MDFSFTEEQQALRDLTRQILGAAEDADRAWADLARAGALGIAVPDEFGGGGGGILEACVVLEEIGRAGLPLPAHGALALGALPLARFGTAEQKAELLPGLASGEGLVTTALVETALDDPGLTPVAARTGSAGWRLDGTMPFVAGADRAVRILVPASTEDGVAVFEVDPAASEGIEIAPQPSSGGEPLFRVALEWAESQRMLGSATDGAEVVTWIAEHAAVGYCALQLGLVERALRLTADYVSQRIQFGRPLGTFQAVQQRAADAYIDVESIRATLWPAAWRLAEGRPPAEAIAVAKFFAAEAGQRVVAAAQHLHGGIGVDMDYPLHRFTFWSKQVELALGGATRHLARLGKAMAVRASEDCA
jgi:alkylation response protein AidB-like acyl-CoA dehydrogenase